MLPTIDFHVHTYYSQCARRLTPIGLPEATPERYMAEAARLGLTTLFFTDHFVEAPSVPGTPQFYKGSGPAIISNLKREIARLEIPEGLQVFVGCETETLSTERVGVSPECAAELDIVLAPTTHYHLPGVPCPRSDAPEDVADHMLTMLASVAQKPWIDAIAHPFYERESLVGDLLRVYESMDLSRLTDTLATLAENRIAVEVNASALVARNCPQYRPMMAQVLPLAKDQGCCFTIGSDAHSVGRLAFPRNEETWLCEIGLGESDFLTLEELQERRAH